MNYLFVIFWFSSPGDGRHEIRFDGAETRDSPPQGVGEGNAYLQPKRQVVTFVPFMMPWPIRYIPEQCN